MERVGGKMKSEASGDQEGGPLKIIVPIVQIKQPHRKGRIT